MEILIRPSRVCGQLSEIFLWCHCEETRRADVAIRIPRPRAAEDVGPYETPVDRKPVGAWALPRPLFRRFQAG